MSGVEILSVEKVAIEYNFNWLSFGIVFGVTLLTIVIFLKIFMGKLDCKLFIVLLCLIFGVVGGVSLAIPEYENQYKVIVSDEVSLNEFSKRYEIIKQEEKIYIVRETD